MSNCAIANNKVLMLDGTLFSAGQGIQVHSQASFMTPYGLIYPYGAAWPILRAIWDAKDENQLTSMEYLRRMLPKYNMHFLHMDWNTRLWNMSVGQMSGLPRMQAILVPQSSKPVLISELLINAEAAVNQTFFDGQSLADAARAMESVIECRMSTPLVIEYEHFKTLKPQGAKSLPVLGPTYPEK